MQTPAERDERERGERERVRVCYLTAKADGYVRCDLHHRDPQTPIQPHKPLGPHQRPASSRHPSMFGPSLSCGVSGHSGADQIERVCKEHCRRARESPREEMTGRWELLVGIAAPRRNFFVEIKKSEAQGVPIIGRERERESVVSGRRLWVSYSRRNDASAVGQIPAPICRDATLSSNGFCQSLHRATDPWWCESSPAPSEIVACSHKRPCTP